MLLPGQNAMHRYDITARAFKQKLKSLMSFITKLHVSGPTRCWIYLFEWQKQGLPHAHILIWLVDKTCPEEIDRVISEDLADLSTDQLLFDIVTTNMIKKSLSPCRADVYSVLLKIATKRTITGVAGYPTYRRRNTDNGRQSITQIIYNPDIDNHCVVPYSLLLSKIFNSHIIVEFCSLVNSIKYI